MEEVGRGGTGVRGDVQIREAALETSEQANKLTR